MSGVSRESKNFYYVGPCQLYYLNTYVRLMVIKKQKPWTSRTTMRNESVPEPFKEPGTPSLYAVCGRDFSKIRNKGRIAPLAEMQRCPVICPDAKDFVDRQAHLLSQKRFVYSFLFKTSQSRHN
jgi:hypothetical protein